MVANFFRVRESTDVDDLALWYGHGRQAARSFAELAERFRSAPSRSRTPSVLKRDVNGVFALQAGEVLCQCWRRGMLSVYRPRFYLPEKDEPRIRYVISWFTFIRWHLAPIFKNRFRADWQSEFATFVDQLIGQRDSLPPDFTAAVSDDAKELTIWRLDLCADVQATACAILAEELEQLLEAVKTQLRERIKTEPPDEQRDEIPWDAATEARNRWIYQQCYKGTQHKAIVAKLAKRTKWEQVGEERVRQIAAEYAAIHHLNPPPVRKRGRRKKQR